MWQKENYVARNKILPTISEIEKIIWAIYFSQNIRFYFKNRQYVAYTLLHCVMTLLKINTVVDSLKVLATYHTIKLIKITYFFRCVTF